MIRVVRSQDRYTSDFDWLQARWLFSFGEYYVPTNERLGALRVFNDDVIQPGTGFTIHPHREMEIITVPLQGEVTHEDSMGNIAVIRAGDVQRMTAGTGLTHSEMNRAREPVHLYQIWIYPRAHGLLPSYDQRRFNPPYWRNQLLIVASGAGGPGAVTLNADATILRARIEKGHCVRHATASGRAVMIYVAGGSVRANTERLADGDQFRAEGETEFVITAETDADLILIDAALTVPSAYRASHQQGIAMMGRMPDLEKIDNLVCLGAIADGYLDEMGEFRPGESWSECATRVGSRSPDLAVWLRQADTRWDALEAKLKVKSTSDPN
jgi:quercetin 2,3-dioxygenase